MWYGRGGGRAGRQERLDGTNFSIIWFYGKVGCSWAFLSFDMFMHIFNSGEGEGDKAKRLDTHLLLLFM